MLGFLIRRLGLAVVTVFGVSVIVFLCARLSGDVTLLLVPMDATEADIAQTRARLGLDASIWVQYGKFAAAALQGDFGESIKYQRPALPLVLERLPATVELALAAFALSVVVGIGLGSLAARRRGGMVDGLTRLLAMLGQSMPHFWIGIVLILVFAVNLKWLPSSGRGGVEHLVMPAATLALFGVAAVMRVTRSAMLEQLGADYIRYLRAKGVGEAGVVWKHALRNALIPVVAISGVLLGNLIGGAVIIETVFSWPGLGSLIVESVFGRDYPVIQTAVFLTSVFLVLLNLAVDLLFGVIDPRIRHG